MPALLRGSLRIDQNDVGPIHLPRLLDVDPVCRAVERPAEHVVQPRPVEVRRDLLAARIQRGAGDLGRRPLDVERGGPEPRPGANGTRMNFFLADRPGGGKVLIELFEAKR